MIFVDENGEGPGVEIEEEGTGAMMQFLAAWGAVLSTLLASIKVYELWSQERVRLTASFFCSGRGGQSDKITITNLSKKPLHITSWKIVWRSVKKDLISLQVAPGRDFSDLTSFTIGSHASHLIEFSRSINSILISR